MKLVLPLLFSCLLFCADAFAQQRAFIVVGKVLSFQDSLRVRELYFDALHEKMTENQPQAQALFNRVLELDPANDAAMYELALISFSQGKDTEAERLARNAVTVKSDNQWYWSLLSDIYKKTNNIAELVLVLDELARLVPEREDYFFDKANALLILKKNDQAISVYDDIEARFGSSDELVAARQRILMQQGRSDKVEEQLEQQIKADPSDVRNYLYLSEIYTRVGDKRKALEILEKAKVIEPSNAIVHLALADTYKSLNQSEKSLEELKAAFADANYSVDEKVRIVLSFFPSFNNTPSRDQAEQLSEVMIQTHPDEAKAFAMHGDVLFQQRKYVEARDAYRKALKLDDQVYQIWEQLLRIEVGQRDYAQAIIDGEESLAVFPNQAELYLFTAVAYAQTQKHEKAVSYLKMAAELELEDKDVRSQIFSALGDSYNALKQYKESDKAYDQALEIDPDNSYVLNNYAYYLSVRGEQLEKAEKMSRRSVYLNPNNASSEDTYAWIMFKLKRYKDARTWIEKALKNDTTNNSTQVEHYGDILYLLGEKDQALVQWQKAKSLGSKSQTLERKINEKKYFD